MKNLKNSCDANSGEVPKQKERNIVSWSQEEDDILREQIRIHGSENWTIIASKFKDKTTRQCRRRWYTYLNTDFKKGGWTPEEDMLLCEAQNIFGNRWTEIAKVVSGRTDNAVKNRFTTLCKKKAKHEALEKENSTTSYTNLNNKRIIFPNGFIAEKRSESSVPLKRLRIHTSSNTENCEQEEKSAVKCGVTDNLVRPPFAVIDENIHVQENCAAENNRIQGTFLKKDDPKVLALIQQAELLSSLAIKVNSDKTDQNLETAWMTLQDYLKQNKVSDPLESKISDANISLEKFKELMENLSSSNESSKQSQSQRDPDIYKLSPTSSEYSTGSNGICHIAASPNEEENILTCNDVKANDSAKCECSNTEFSSPVHVIPLFRSLAATIPTPEFSESEKHFLMKTLGMESPSPNPSTNPSKPPPCKRSLLHCL